MNKQEIINRNNSSSHTLLLT